MVMRVEALVVGLELAALMEMYSCNIDNSDSQAMKGWNQTLEVCVCEMLARGHSVTVSTQLLMHLVPPHDPKLLMFQLDKLQYNHGPNNAGGMQLVLRENMILRQLLCASDLRLRKLETEWRVTRSIIGLCRIVHLAPLHC